VGTVYRALSPSEQTSTVIVTANYGEAGAIDHYGSRYGLPRAFSGHNSYWFWGVPRPPLGTAILVGFHSVARHPYFRDVAVAARIHNAAGVHNDEEGLPIWLCRGQMQPWPTIWPAFRHYD
ncbi:MAG: hypothetical protein ABR564_00725, partial [Candidatus Dormibacteria bacterium]